MRTTLQDLETALGAQDDATGALSLWCSLHRFCETPRIRVERLHIQLSAEPCVPPEVHALLQLAPAEITGFRHVRLTCGTRVLSEARNWFVPDRLTPEMNRTLTETDTPFGEAVSALAFRRERLASILGPGFPDCPPETILTHRALLRRADGLPIALVVECYQPDVLAIDGTGSR